MSETAEEKADGVSGETKALVGEAKAPVEGVKTSSVGAKASAGEMEFSVLETKVLAGETKSPMEEGKVSSTGVKNLAGEAKLPSGEAKAVVGEAKTLAGEAKLLAGERKDSASSGETKAKTGEAKLTPQVRNAMIALIVGGIAAILDSTMVTLAVHTLVVDLHSTAGTIQWVTTAYLLAMAVAIPITGWAESRWGGKRVWVGALLVFVVGSILCAASWSD